VALLLFPGYSSESALLDYAERLILDAMGEEHAALYEPFVLGCFYADILRAHAQLHSRNDLR
jgi:hypothetical protein